MMPKEPTEPEEVNNDFGDDNGEFAMPVLDEETPRGQGDNR